jgi:hypoxanthine phosphoribosyltransferase
MKPNLDLRNRKILVIEDIIDSGSTINLINDYLKKQQVKSIKIITFLIKKTKKQVKTTPKIDWFGFEIEDLFVVGYGLDYEETLRNLPYVGNLVLLN